MEPVDIGPGVQVGVVEFGCAGHAVRVVVTNLAVGRTDAWLVTVLGPGVVIEKEKVAILGPVEGSTLKTRVAVPTPKLVLAAPGHNMDPLTKSSNSNWDMAVLRRSQVYVEGVPFGSSGGTVKIGVIVSVAVYGITRDLWS